jgi:hypothetical protein
MVATPGGALLLRDAYKSSLDSIDAALDAFGQIPARREIVVPGDVEQFPAESVMSIGVWEIIARSSSAAGRWTITSHWATSRNRSRQLRRWTPVPR